MARERRVSERRELCGREHVQVFQRREQSRVTVVWEGGERRLCIVVQSERARRQERERRADETGDRDLHRGEQEHQGFSLSLSLLTPLDALSAAVSRLHVGPHDCDQLCVFFPLG